MEKIDTFNNQNVLENKPIKQKEVLQYDRVDYVFAFVLPVLGFLFIKLIVAAAVSGGHLGAGVTVFTICFVAAALVWFGKSGVRIRASAWIALIPILLTGGYFAIYQNATLQALALPLLVVMGAYFTLSLGGRRVEAATGPYLLFDLYAALLSIPLGYMGKMFAIHGDRLKKVKKSGSAMMLILGIILALPISIYIGSLLRDADAAFEMIWLRFIEGLLSKDLIITIIQILISLPVGMYLYGLMFGSVRRQGDAPIKAEDAAKRAGKVKILPLYLVVGGLTPLLLVYLLFFFSQTAYFLSAFRGLLPEGMIYSEYARRGFFELCDVSFINFLFASLLLFFTKKGGESTLSRIYGALLAAFSLALIAMSISKMLLYINIYGLTPLRLYTSWFMLFLFLLFVMTAVRLARPRFNLIKYCVYCGVAMFLILCYADTDGMIAAYNVNGYRTGKLAQLDVGLLLDLGGGATPWLIEIMEDGHMEESYRRQAGAVLSYMIDQARQDIREGDWRSATVTGRASNRLLIEKEGLIWSSIR